VTFSRFWFLEEKEVYVVLAFFVGGEVLDGKGEFRVSQPTAHRFIAISGFCSSKGEFVFETLESQCC